MFGPGGSAPSSSSSALQPLDNPTTGVDPGSRMAAGRRLKSLCPHILLDVEFPSETCVRVGRGPPKRGDNVKAVTVNVPQVSKFHFELSIGAPLPGQSVPGWIISNRSRGGTFVGRTLQSCRKVGRSGVSHISDGEMIFLFPPDKGPILGYQLVLGASPAPSAAQPSRQPTTPQLSGQKRRRDSSSSELPGEEEISEELRCAICQDLMYRPVSVLDCLHNFCSSCLSQWLQRHTDCPQCRSRVRSVKPNRTVVNLTEKLVEAEKIRDRRSEQEKKQSDDSDTLLKNDYDLGKVNRGFLLAAHGSATSAGTIGRSDVTYSDYDDEYDDDEDPYDSEEDEEEYHFAMGMGMLFHLQGPRCAYCQAINPVPGSRCVQNALHVSCNTCRMAVPDRPDLHVRCAVCTKAYCTPATNRQCLSASGQGLAGPSPGSSSTQMWSSDPNLRRLRDLMVFSRPLAFVVIYRAFGENVFETTAFEEHLQGARKSIEDVTREVLARDQTAKFKFEVDGATREVQVRDFYNDHYVCSKCAYQAVKQCIFQYRKSLAEEQLPQRCRGRENCWYGTACRTQKHSSTHAARLNHICDQTRF
ncbi:hypothetical protein FOZ60_016730 [Perkinsus olseni]|uniref:E3 ubiquitin-protein ligase CHFR n=2 Tax=Perkinsus olseni TaxID=32597 RepID=A0A7J6P471_PEROL|nr:hypothetical protein FOZ60_016730 [Perkinsus olseni]